MTELKVHGATMKFDRSAEAIIQKARRLSVRYSSSGEFQPFPSIKYELIMLSFIDLRHPMYTSIADRFSLSSPTLKNLLHNYLLQTGCDAPSQNNKKMQEQFFIEVEACAKQDQSFRICPKHLIQTIFNSEHDQNYVLKVFADEFKIAPEIIRKFVSDYESLDIARRRDTDILGDDQIDGYLSSLHKIKKYVFGSEDTSGEEEAKVKVEPPSARDVTDQAEKEIVVKTIGRDEEITAIGEILNHKDQNNVLLVGEPGVGKTAVIEGFSRRIKRDSKLKRFQSHSVVEVDVHDLAMEMSNPQRFLAKVKSVFDKAASDSSLLIYIPELHELFGEKSRQNKEFASILKSYLKKEKFQMIASITPSEYIRYIEKDEVLAWHFRLVKIDEPCKETCLDILKLLASNYEDHHKIKIESSAVEASIEYTARYIKDTFLPGKALSVLDWASSRVALSSKTPKVVTRETIAQIISEKTDIPVAQILFSKEVVFQSLEKKLKERVIGQDHAIERIVDTLYLTKYEMDMKPERPDGVFLITGPTGTGKTELAKSIATILLGKEDELIRIDMSEFMEKHNVAKLIGSPPGYKDSDQGGMLTNAVRQNPYSVILLDEVEKAHPSVFKLFLQVFDDGRLTDAMGQTVNFCHSTVIMTSNLGIENLKLEEIEQLKPENIQEYIRLRVEPSIKKWFPPEFLNRLDDILFFNFLSPKVIEKIADKKLSDVQLRFKEKSKTIEINESVKKHIIEKGYNPEYGCRHLNRTLEDILLKPLTKYLVHHQDKGKISVSLDEQGVILFD